jgi:hypothetical protein
VQRASDAGVLPDELVAARDPGWAVIKNTVVFNANDGSILLELPLFLQENFEPDPEWERLMQNLPEAFRAKEWRLFIVKTMHQAQCLATGKERQIVYCVVRVDGTYVVREMTTSQLAESIAADPTPRLDRDVFPTRFEAELRRDELQN